MKKLAGLLSVFALTGCAATYIAPEGDSGTMASLVLPVKESSWKFFGGFSGGRVAFGLADGSGCGRYYKDIPAQNEGDKEVTITIPTNQDVLVGYFTNSGNWVCNVQGSFKAEAGGEYKIVKLGNGYRCSVGVLDITGGKSGDPLTLGKTKQDSLTGKVCKV